MLLIHPIFSYLRLFRTSLSCCQAQWLCSCCTRTWYSRCYICKDRVGNRIKWMRPVVLVCISLVWPSHWCCEESLVILGNTNAACWEDLCGGSNWATVSSILFSVSLPPDASMIMFTFKMFLGLGGVLWWVLRRVVVPCGFWARFSCVCAGW